MKGKDFFATKAFTKSRIAEFYDEQKTRGLTCPFSFLKFTAYDCRQNNKHCV